MRVIPVELSTTKLRYEACLFEKMILSASILL
jgi:hypothetical protein